MLLDSDAEAVEAVKSGEIKIFSPEQEREAEAEYHRLKNLLITLESDHSDEFLHYAVLLHAFIDRNSEALRRVESEICSDLNWEDNDKPGILHRADVELGIMPKKVQVEKFEDTKRAERNSAQENVRRSPKFIRRPKA